MQMKALEEFSLIQDLHTDQAGNLEKENMALLVLRRGVRGLDHGPTLSGDLN